MICRAGVVWLSMVNYIQRGQPCCCAKLVSIFLAISILCNTRICKFNGFKVQVNVCCSLTGLCTSIAIFYFSRTQMKWKFHHFILIVTRQVVAVKIQRKWHYKIPQDLNCNGIVLCCQNCMSCFFFCDCF